MPFSDNDLEQILSREGYSIINEFSASLNHIAIGKTDKKKHKFKKHKYNAKKKAIEAWRYDQSLPEGTMITFASTGEADRYVELCQQASLGIIQHEEKWLQVPFVLEEGRTNEHGFKHRTVRYLADFVYRVGEITVVEDFKGYETAEFKRKKRMLEAMFKGTKKFLWVNNNKEAVFTPHIHLLRK